MWRMLSGTCLFFTNGCMPNVHRMEWGMESGSIWALDTYNGQAETALGAGENPMERYPLLH